MDCTLSTWDLARSIGVDHGDGDESAAAPLIEFACSYFPKVREKTDHVRFGTAAHGGPTASVVDELAAMPGRDTAWSPSF